MNIINQMSLSFALTAKQCQALSGYFSLLSDKDLMVHCCNSLTCAKNFN